MRLQDYIDYDPYYEGPHRRIYSLDYDGSYDGEMGWAAILEEEAVRHEQEVLSKLDK